MKESLWKGEKERLYLKGEDYIESWSFVIVAITSTHNF